ncbi:MAG: multiheme c-type cytochrome [Myxococcales bacterium]
MRDVESSAQTRSAGRSRFLPGHGPLHCIASSLIVAACLGCEDAAQPKDAKPVEESSFAEGFASPKACGGCHPSQYSQWRVSNHAYALTDPVFRAMNALGQAETQGALGSFCVECHAPVAARTGQAAVFQDPNDGTFRQDLDALDEEARHGVSCDVCHTFTKVISTGKNAHFETVPDGTRRARIRDPIPNSFHRSEYGESFETARMCGPCHDLISEFFSKPVRLESTFREWVVSGFNDGTTCQECHMPEAVGPASLGGPERTIHDHTMVGVDVSLLAPEAFPGFDTMRAATIELLQRSAELTWAWDALARDLAVQIANLAGHSLPSGSATDREMWVELTVLDVQGSVVFASGALDARGDLKDDRPEHTLEPGADPQLVLFRQRMRFDPALEGQTGEPHDVDFLWEPNTFEDNLIGAGGDLWVHYDLSSLPPGNYEVKGRLLFRTFPPYVLRKLVDRRLLDAEVLGRVPVVVMEELEQVIQVP